MHPQSNTHPQKGVIAIDANMNVVSAANSLLFIREVFTSRGSVATGQTNVRPVEVIVIV